MKIQKINKLGIFLTSFILIVTFPFFAQKSRIILSGFDSVKCSIYYDYYENDSWIQLELMKDSLLFYGDIIPFSCILTHKLRKGGRIRLVYDGKKVILIDNILKHRDILIDYNEFYIRVGFFKYKSVYFR
jgi:hypothetical protein